MRNDDVTPGRGDGYSPGQVQGFGVGECPGHSDGYGGGCNGYNNGGGWLQGTLLDYRLRSHDEK